MEVTDEFELMDIELKDDEFEFTLAEIIEMEHLFKEMREKLISQTFCQELATKFSHSVHRSEKSPVKWEQVQCWFQDKQSTLEAKAIQYFCPEETLAYPRASPVKRREWNDIGNPHSISIPSSYTKHGPVSYYVKSPHVITWANSFCKLLPVSTISISDAAVELPNLIFEARSAKDYAWFDVAYFLNFRVLNSGELMVRVRFAGFDREEDEWVSVDRAIRERSIPLVSTECGSVNVGDQVLCYRVNEYHALYVDAHITEIERKLHDESDCSCTFTVRYDYDNAEEKVGYSHLCRRPTKSLWKGSKASSFSIVS